jgi:hypothetical protein
MTISRHPNDRIAVFERLISAGLSDADGSTPEIQTIRAADQRHQAEFGHLRPFTF